MQDPSGDKVCRAGGEEEGEDGQHTSRVHDTEASSHRTEPSSHGTEPSSHRTEASSHHTEPSSHHTEPSSHGTQASSRPSELNPSPSELNPHPSEAENDHDNSPHANHAQDFGSEAATPGSLYLGSPVEARMVVQEAAIAPQGEQAPIIPGPSGDAATTTGSRLLELYLL